jgi:hypothetical protein
VVGATLLELELLLASLLALLALLALLLVNDSFPTNSVACRGISPAIFSLRWRNSQRCSST